MYPTLRLFPARVLQHKFDALRASVLTLLNQIEALEKDIATVPATSRRM
jgi:hypothetical protein